MVAPPYFSKNRQPYFFCWETHVFDSPPACIWEMSRYPCKNEERKSVRVERGQNGHDWMSMKQSNFDFLTVSIDCEI